MAHDLVLNTLQILEEESVVAWRGILWILLWWAHYRGSYFLQIRMEAVDLSTGAHFERNMMQRPWFSAIDRVAHESSSR
jgi:hypothetical protein